MLAFFNAEKRKHKDGEIGRFYFHQRFHIQTNDLLKNFFQTKWRRKTH